MLKAKKEMILQKLKIKGFRCFNEEQVFAFAKSGFFYIVGENTKEPWLGANGAGKSTIFEALCWVLFGKTSSGVKAGNVKNWHGTEECEVLLLFEKQGSNYALLRTYKPNQIQVSINGEPYKTITQEEVEDLFGLNFQSFLFTCFISQFSAKFFDLSPSDKLEVFSQTLNLDKWVGYSVRAGELLTEIVDGLNEKNMEAQRLEGELKSLQQIDYTKQHQEWASQQRIRLAEKRKKQELLTDEINELKSGLSKYKQGLESLLQTEISLKVELASNNKIESEASAIVNNLFKTVSIQRNKIGELEGDIESLRGIGASCPTCLQRVSKSHIAANLRAVKTRIDELKKDVAEYSQKYNKALNNKSKISKDREDIEARLNRTKTEIVRVKDRIKSNQENIQNKESELSECDSEIQEEVKQTNPFIGMTNKRNSEIRIVKAEINRVNTEQKQLQKQESIYTFWKKGFKDVRLFIVNKAIMELQLEMNNSLQELGLHDWNIILKVDRETKSKTISKGFTVMVNSPTNEELVPFECWSGGEAQRLKLAGTLAISDFIRNRTGKNWNLEAFDEPTAWLGKEGITDLLEVLGQRSIDNGRAIYIIDHRDFESFGGFDGEYKVVKTQKGSYIESLTEP